jgi:hypothetical protein
MIRRGRRLRTASSRLAARIPNTTTAATTVTTERTVSDRTNTCSKPTSRNHSQSV